VLAALAFPPFHLGPVIFVALVPFFDAVRLAEEAPRGRRGASGLVYLGGMLHFALLLYWILFLPAAEVTVPGLIFPAFALMVAYLGLFLFAAQAAARRGARLGVPWWLALPVAWVGCEYLRSQSQLAFPWVLAGYGLIETPRLLQFLSLTGIFGGSLFVCLVNGCVWAALRARGRRRVAFAAAALGLVGAALAHGSFALARLGPARTIEVALIQGNIGHEIKFNPEYRSANLTRLMALSEEAVAQSPVRPDLVIWPETAATCYLKLDPGCRTLLSSFVDRLGVPLLTGAPDVERRPDGTRRHTNAAFLIAPGQGPVGEYAKVNLVPFGEAFPYQDRFPLLEQIDFGEADFDRGPGFTPLAIPGGDLAGVMICFESIFPHIGRAYARAGAGFFANLTNDEWFGASGGPYQHAAMAAARAIETRRGLARAANTGVSFVVDRGGRVSRATRLFTPAAVVAPVEIGTGETGYMRIGDLVPALCLAATALWALRGHRRPPAAV
jgi:apolipoprotein N-acyltransferase